MPNTPPKTDNWNKLTGGANPPAQPSPQPSTPSTPAPDNWDKIFGQGSSETFKPAPNNPTDIVANMPNADKLTASERWLYGKLPGFSESTVGKALGKFGETWAGKALNWLDIGAEGVERSVGLAAQLLNAKPGEEVNLKDAWYAGSLAGDMFNLPTLRRDKDGKVTGISIPNDLPGVNGMVQARQKIAQYVAQGMSENEALIKTRDEYYNGLGALALRAQLYDTYFHVVADPLNYIMPALKPVEALQARRISALTGKIAYSAEELTSFANKAQDAANLAKTAGKLEDAASYANEAQRLTELVGQVSRGEVKQLDRLDKFSILLTGGDPLAKPTGKFTNFITKPFQLTPQSKAQELLTMVNNNISTKIVARLWDDPDAINKIADTVSRASKGATGVEYGHAFLTMEGRTVQGFLGGSDTLVNKIREDFNALERERGLLQVLKDTVGDTPESILKQAAESPEVLFKTLQEKALASPLAAQLMQSGELTPDSLNQLSKILKDVPYDKETAIVHMLGALEEQAARQAIVQFGVEKNGLLTRWSNAIKSAESLAFMRINPSYAVRNAINNEVTLVSRGVFNIMGEAEIREFWTDQGFVPKRLADAFTAAGEKLTTGKGEQVISEATRVKGKLEDFKQFVNDIQLGKGNILDVTKHSQAMEQSASRRAMTSGYQQFFHKFWKPPRLENALDGATMDAIEAIDSTIPDVLNDAIKASYGSKKKFYETLGRNLNLNPESVMKAASDKIGMDVKELLGDEVLAKLNAKLPEAIEKGKTEQFVLEMQQAIEDHVDEVFNRNVQDIVDNTAAQVQAGGPQMFYRKVSDAQDAFWGAHIEHSIKSPGQWDAFREAKNAREWARASSIAERNIASDERFFARAFKRVDAYLEGLERGAKEAAIPFPGEVRQGFKDFQRNWRDFFTFRNSEYKRINQLPWQERGVAFDELQSVVDKRYKDAIALEDEVMQRADDAVSNLIQDPAQKQIFTAYRDQMAALTRQDKEKVLKMWETVRKAPPDKRAEILNQFWSERKVRFDELRATDRAGLTAMQGDPNASAVFEQATQKTTQAATENTGGTVYQIANEYGIPSATETGSRNDRRLLNVVNKYLPEGQAKFKKVQDVPEDIARQAFEGYKADKAGYVKSINTPAPRPFIMDVKSVVPDLPPIDLGLSELSQRQSIALDAIIEAAGEQAKKTPVILNKLPPELQKKVMGFVDNLDDEFSSAKLAATKYGEFRRDSALLNYSRRTNFDASMAVVFPFAFWSTNSIGKWAVESIDRPAMFTSYLRMKKILETAGAPQQGFPSRFKDNIRVHLPFAPSWMGDQFIDPMRLILPFDAFAQPIEQYQKSQLTIEGRSERTLDTLLQNGKITQDQYQQALANHAGPAWDMAKSQTVQNDDTLKFDAWDFANLMSSPHAPLQWAFNAARGTPDEIGPFTPMARTSRQIATLLGVDDYVNSPWNIEGKIRKHLGLPAFDKWEDYRVDREISNFAGTGEFTVKQVQEAMVVSSLVAQGKLTHEEAMQNEIYKQATSRSNMTYSGGKAGAALSILGINVKSYPEGEQNLRALQDDFSAAYDKYHVANQSLDKFMAAHPNMTQEDASAMWEKQNPGLARDAESLTKFFDAHPEYEQRLGLWDKPEERLKKFMVDSMWAQWNSLPKMTKDELKDQMGDTFANAFVNKETRSYDAMTVEQMQVFLKLMGGKETPGILTADQRMLTDFFSGNLKLTDSETAWRTQVFYDQRQAQFKDYYDLQKGYYALKSKSQQKKYLSQNPQLKQYWGWRREFLNNNPDIVPYLTDNPKDIARAQKARRNPEIAVPQANEIKANISPAAQNLLSQYAQGGDLPFEVEQYLEVVADGYGMTQQELMGILGLPIR
jgi:hypothetical protein